MRCFSALTRCSNRRWQSFWVASWLTALVQTERKQSTCVDGVFVAGDADGDTQFAVVAAAEGAIAATAINALLQKQDML